MQPAAEDRKPLGTAAGLGMRAGHVQALAVRMGKQALVMISAPVRWWFTAIVSAMRSSACRSLTDSKQRDAMAAATHAINKTTMLETLQYARRPACDAVRNKGTQLITCKPQRSPSFVQKPDHSTGPQR